nr:uncharacterized protein LOC117276998 [Nicotiana tomentosiformis]
MQAARYNLLHNDLYKRTYGGPLAICFDPNQTQHVEEIHEGHCGALSGDRALIRCIIQAGYYWPTMKTDASKFVKKCEQSKKYAPIIDRAREHLHSVTSPWPFIKWGIDIVGPLPPGRAGNGRAKSPNKSTLNIMKKKLEEAKGLWSEILPEVLWAHRTTLQTSTKWTPYFLVYGMEEVTPVKVGEPSLSYSHESGTSNDKNSRQDLDEVEERRDMAYIRMVAHKQQA